MRNRLLFLSFFVCLWPMSFCFAQYGSGVDGNRNDGCGLRYADSIRTHLTANASSGQAVVTVNDASAFSNGDLCLVIQMLGTGVGQYEERTISSISGNNITFTSNLTYAYAYTASTNIAQVIRIFQFSNVTLKTPGDQITCHAWDGFTGGVCYFYVSGTLDADADGIITVAGKGYRGGSGGNIVDASGTNQVGGPGTRGTAGNPGKSGQSLGSSGCTPVTGGGGGGAGGLIVGKDGGAGGRFSPSNNITDVVTYLNSAGDGINGSDGNDGEGPGAGTSSSAATNNSNSGNWGTTAGSGLLMGGGGSGGKQGLSSGRAGGGGGGGGGAVNGINGTCGNSGTSGVQGGTGGTGGGILVMRANIVQGAGVISVGGGNGGNGATGSTGGNGGPGGGPGGTAGGGGGGAGGTGGGGSCPGHGGAAGSLWVGNFYSGYTFITNGGIKGAYGAGGTGGTGGNGANGSTAGNDGPDDGQGGPGGYGGWSADGCKGDAGTPSDNSNPGKQTGKAGGNGGAVGCNDDSYCASFAGGSAVVVLPIELLSFTGFSKNAVNLLRWVTLTETNNDYFTLYRSEDSENWHEISRVDGAGTSNMQRYYEHVDENPINDKINYYQLQQSDFDGKFTKSNIIAIVPKGKSGIYIAENEIKIIVSAASTVDFEIIDMAGHVVEKVGPKEMQQGILSVNISTLPASIYLLRLRVGYKIESIKFVKK